MIKEKLVLDENIILYKKDFNVDLYNIILSLSNIESAQNIWEIAYSNNLSNTKHIYDKSIINLPTGDFLFPESLNNLPFVKEMFNIKNILTDHVFECIIDYSQHYELILKKIKNWTLSKQNSGTISHDDMNMDGNRHNFSILVCINNNFDGGDIVFENRIGNESITMSVGDILIYPSNSKYNHYELDIVSGTKYTAISYFN